LFELEAAARQEMLDLVPEKIPEGESHWQAFLSAAGMRYVVDHLDVIYLARSMKGGYVLR